ncbi:MAG: hypothetical protein ACTSQY_00730 [Candidatus Odinarchaeia archaeon]
MNSAGRKKRTRRFVCSCCGKCFQDTEPYPDNEGCACPDCMQKFYDLVCQNCGKLRIDCECDLDSEGD